MSKIKHLQSLLIKAIGWLLPDQLNQSNEDNLSEDQIDRILWRHEEASKTIRRVVYILVGICLFCVLTLALPDDRLLLPDAKVILPIINYNISFHDFLGVGPIIIICLAIYLHILYGNLPIIIDRNNTNPRTLPTLFNIYQPTARFVTWFIFYMMPPLVVAYFAWKALPHPQMGIRLIFTTFFPFAFSISEIEYPRKLFLICPR